MQIDASSAPVWIALIAMVGTVLTAIISIRGQNKLVSKADQTHGIMKEVEHNVNGRLSRQIQIAEDNAADAALMRAEMAALKTLVAESLDHRSGATAEIRAAISTPPSPTPEPPPPFISAPIGGGTAAAVTAATVVADAAVAKKDEIVARQK